MELDLGYKLTKILDDFAYVDLLIAKDRTGPVFISKETDIMFILTTHLKGYTRDQIKIDINKHGSTILISGKKPVQEMVMVGLKVHKKEIEMREFRKAFKIPDGVILDKIKVRFNEDKSMLTISMPKVIEGVKGVEIEEVKEEEEEEDIARGNSESLQVEADEEIDRETFELQESAESGGKDAQNIDKIPDKLSASAELDAKDAQNIENVPEKLPVSAELVGKDAQKVDLVSDKLSVYEYEKEVASKRKEMESKEVLDLKGEIENEVQEEKLMEQKTQEEERSDNMKSTEIKKKFRDQSTQTNAPERPKKCCTPMIAGSALLVSLMVFVIHLIRANDKPSKKKQ